MDRAVFKIGFKNADKSSSWPGQTWKIHHLHVLRRFTQIAFILFIFLAPSLNILRYDSATRELIVFGSVWSLGINEIVNSNNLLGASQITLIIIFKGILPWLFVLSIFPLLGVFAGRFFCGWLCPEGAMFELADYLTLKLKGGRSIYSKNAKDPYLKSERKLFFSIITILCLFLIPFISGIALTGYFIAPETVWHQIMNLKFTFGVKAGIIGVSVYMFVTSIFVRHLFCRYVCAAGLMQMLFGWISPYSLRLKMDVSRISECTDCRRCEQACFMDILPRKNKKNISCVNCGACIVACDRELGKGRGLFHFRFGDKERIDNKENCKNLQPQLSPVCRANGTGREDSV